MDYLSTFFDHFALSARVFYSGRLCGTSGDHDSTSTGHLHLLRNGKLTVIQQNGRKLVIERPSVLFYPGPSRHRLSTDERTGAEIVCASIEFGTGALNPLVLALPELLILPLDSAKELESAVEMLFAEAFADHPGRRTALDRLTEYFLVLVLRSATKSGLVKGGVLMGLADPRLAQAILAIYKNPETNWSLEELAEKSGMSRARFAAHFRKVVGTTPFELITDCRIGAAQRLLRRGEALKIVAPSVGYASSTALTRAFSERIGLSPTEWLAQVAAEPAQHARVR